MKIKQSKANKNRLLSRHKLVTMYTTAYSY